MGAADGEKARAAGHAAANRPSSAAGRFCRAGSTRFGKTPRPGPATISGSMGKQK